MPETTTEKMPLTEQELLDLGPGSLIEMADDDDGEMETFIVQTADPNMGLVVVFSVSNGVVHTNDQVVLVPCLIGDVWPVRVKPKPQPRPAQPTPQTPTANLQLTPA